MPSKDGLLVGEREVQLGICRDGKLIETRPRRGASEKASEDEI